MLEFAVKKNESVSVHQQLVTGLKHYAIKLGAEKKMPSENIICKKYSLARMTVSRALNDLVAEGILYRTQGKGTFVKKQLRTVKSIKFLLPGPGCLSGSDANSKVIRRYLSGIVHEAHKTGMRVETVICTPDHKLGSLQPDQFRSFSKNDNVFILAQWWYPIFPALVESGCNVVYINSQIMNPEFEDYFKHWYLLTNNIKESVAELVDYFVKAGHRNILCFRLKDQFTSPDPRSEGYKLGLKRNSLEYDPILMPEIDFDIFSDPEYVIRLIIESYHKRRFDAIIIPNSEFALLTLTALERLKLKCPENVIISALGDREILSNLPVPISAFAQSEAMLGAEAVKAFKRSEFTSGEQIFNSIFIERESCRKGAGATPNPFLDENHNQSFDENIFSY
jgi:DNA-binding LacI/PurR family transcriptional regulator